MFIKEKPIVTEQQLCEVITTCVPIKLPVLKQNNIWTKQTMKGTWQKLQLCGVFHKITVKQNVINKNIYINFKIQIIRTWQV